MYIYIYIYIRVFFFYHKSTLNSHPNRFMALRFTEIYFCVFL